MTPEQTQALAEHAEADAAYRAAYPGWCKVQELYRAPNSKLSIADFLAARTAFDALREAWSQADIACHDCGVWEAQAREELRAKRLAIVAPRRALKARQLPLLGE